MGITHLFSKDGNDWGSVDTAIFKADLKEILTNRGNKQLGYEHGVRTCTKMKPWTAEENEDWGIKVDADKVAADQKTNEDSL